MRFMYSLSRIHKSLRTHEHSCSYQSSCYYSAVAVCTKTQNFEIKRQVLDEIPQRSLSDNNYLLFEYSRDNRNIEALNLYLGINKSGFPVDWSSFSCILKVCGCLFDQNAGKHVHTQCIKSGFLEDVSVGTSLLDMYLKTGSVENGQKVFDEMPEKNVVSWTSLLAGYTKNGLVENAVDLFFQMQVEGIKPNPLTFASVFGALASQGAGRKGTQIHTMVIKNGFEPTTFVGNSLINMYSKSGMIRDARLVFDNMENRDSVSWNSMISGLVTNKHDFEALDLFHKMRLADITLTQMIFATIIKVCANLKELSFTKQLHCRLLKSGFDSDPNARTALMASYTKCKEIDNAFKLFCTMTSVHNVVSWTAMISGYLQNRRLDQAVDLFIEMSREGIKPNHFTYSAILSAHPLLSLLQIHSQVIKTNYEVSPSVGTALLDNYVKIGKIDEAYKVFEIIHGKDIVAWSAMLAGFAQIGDTEGAIRVFRELGKEKIHPNEFTFSSIIHACANRTATIEQGKQFHSASIKFGYNNALCVGSALVTLYAKRGNIESANQVFKRQKERDLVSWNAMISGYAQHGYGEKALEIFEEMQKCNLEMDGITFIGVITACTHAGLVNEGEKYFDMMVKDHQIDPTMEHYSCMVDLYSRAGFLEKATALIDRMPFPAGGTIWRSLLAACRVHRKLELGQLAGEKLITLQPQDSAAYVLLSNLYATMGCWQERAEIRKLMDERKVKKETGYSWIEIKNQTYSFVAGDKSNPFSDQIYAKLEELSSRLKDIGYIPDTSYVLHDVEDEHKEAILSQHSERLAIAFGLISTSNGTLLQIVKNLRVCGDCHTVIKLISLIEKREIVVRDSNRYHHFKEGLCSCGEYW